MPKHTDFQKIYDSMVKEYGTEKGERVYYGTMKKFDCNDEISMEENHHQKRCNIGEQSFKDVDRVLTIFPFNPILIEKVTEGEALKIRGICARSGQSRNIWFFTEQTLRDFEQKLKNAPLYGEHISYYNAIGRLTSTWIMDDELWYTADVFEEQAKIKILNGLVRFVSVAADYKSVEQVDGIVPKDLENADLSLVAVGGISGTNIELVESLSHENAPIRQTLEMQKTIFELNERVLQVESLRKEVKELKELFDRVICGSSVKESKQKTNPRELSNAELKAESDRRIRLLVLGHE